MTTQFLGPTSIGGQVPGLQVACGICGTALLDLTAVLQVQIPIIIEANLVISTQVDLLAAAGIAIRIPAVVDFEALLQANLDITAGLTLQITDPSLFIQGILAGMAQVQIGLAISTPSVELGLQLAANAAIGLSLEAKIAAIDLQLEALVSIGAALQLQAQALAAIQIALSASLLTGLQALGIVAQYHAAFLATPVYSFMFEGIASTFGAEADAAISVAGLSGMTVRAPYFLAESANVDVTNSTNLIFRTG